MDLAFSNYYCDGLMVTLFLSFLHLLMFCKEELSLLIYLFSYLSVCTLLFFYLVLSYPFVTSFMAQLFQLWPLGIFSVASCALLTTPYPLLRTSFLSGTIRCSRLMGLSLGPVTSPRTPGFFFRRVAFKHQDLGARYAHCY